MVAEKIETLVVFMEGKKKIETTWCSWLGPRAGAEAGAERENTRSKKKKI